MERRLGQGCLCGACQDGYSRQDLLCVRLCENSRLLVRLILSFVAKSTDPSLQPLLSAISDPFGSYDAAALEEGKIFSVLAP